MKAIAARSGLVDKYDVGCFGLHSLAQAINISRSCPNFAKDFYLS
jgi:hypothetical protein